MRMLCLSVKQPWAECIVNGSKSIEIRTWAPPWEVCDLVVAARRYPETHQAPLFAIHAGKGPDSDAPPGVWIGANLGAWQKRVGGIVGVVRLVGWHWYRTDIGHDGEAYRGREQFELEQPLHLNPLSWWREGLCAWVFAEQRGLETMVPLRGQPGVWEVPEKVARAVEADDPAVG
jgi:hypothetical protein